VKLAAFAIDRTEASCSAFCGGGGGCTGSLDDGVASWCATDGSWPVAYETWAEARAFCQARGGDLCTEAQWERAARTSLADGVYQATLRTWPWGESEPVCGVTAHFASTGAGCATGKPAAVDSYAAGASFFGLLHLAGNIEEWVLDWYAADAYVLSPLEDPSGPADGTSRVTRGGSWLRLSGQLHAFTRTPKAPGAREDKYGVRCCYPVPDPDLGL
jgi:iron(II)-dependent oxidoreductase